MKYMVPFARHETLARRASEGVFARSPSFALPIGVTSLLVLLLLSQRGFAQRGVEVEEQFATAVRAAVEDSAPSVLRIETFGGLEKVGDVLFGQGPTTALAVSEDGYLICSAFSFAQQPTSILVTMPSGKRAAAKIVARDHARMLVLLKVNSDEKLKPPKAVPRGEMTVGQTTIALGRTYDKQTPNVSVGILSATNRIWGKAIQTDAKISPSNYGGPLIDLSGRVLGVLVPMSPQGEGELAGAEWYDSGIGFAVPLADVYERLDVLRRGEDLHPGKLGVSLGGGMYEEPVEIAAVLPGSPAARAGLQKGDHIVEVEGTPIRWQAHLRHQLGPRYAGDVVNMALQRGEQRIATQVELVADVAPYDVPFLGILPLRDFEGEGVKVRFVYPNSPAAEAGIQPGDVIRSFGELQVNGAGALRDAVGTHDRNDTPRVEIELQRDGKTQKVQTSLASLPTEIPPPLPPARAANPAAEQERPAVGLVEIVLAEERNDCFAYVPPTYNSAIDYGLIVSLHAPGKFDKGKIEPRWGELAAKHNLIVLAPRAAKDDQWEPTEAEFVRKAIDDVMSRYNIDRTRVAVYGHQAGGTFGYLVAFANEEIVRGVATVDSALPARAAPPDSDPVQRMAFFIATAKASELSDRIDAGIKRLREKKLPVTVKDLGDEPRPLSDEERGELARWVDSLDRI